MMETVSVTLKQFPLPALVNVRRTEPDATSAGDGIYVPVSVVLFGLNVPVPDVLQVPLPVEEVPVYNALGMLLQRNIVVPASTTGAFVIVMTIESITDRHVPLSVVVRYNVTDPTAVSPALGE